MPLLALAPALVLAATLLPPPPPSGADPPGPITCGVLLDEGTQLLGRNDGRIVPVDPRTGESEGRDPFAQHADSATDLAVDPTAEFVAAGSSGSVVALSYGRGGS